MVIQRTWSPWSTLVKHSVPGLLVLAVVLQVKELGDALAAVSGSAANTTAARQMAVKVVEVLAARQAERTGTYVLKTVLLWLFCLAQPIVQAGPA
jgi:hypothetical protein